MSKVLHERGSGNLPSSTEMNSRDHVKSISTTVEIKTTLIRRVGTSRYAGLYELKDLDAYSIRTTLLDDALSTKAKDLESFTLPCIINNLCFNNALADLGSSVSVIPFSTYTKLGVDLKRNQVDDLEPTIKEGEVINEPMMDIFKTRSDGEIIDGLDEYPSYCNFD
nr:hypothetical protein [Tanacetum cinerariifolium]